MKIAILPGDGIGTEIVAEALKVLERLRREPLLQGRTFAQLQLRRLDGEGADPQLAGLTEFVLRSSLLPIVTGTAGTPARANPGTTPGMTPGTTL